jgi:hypothetical protein
VLYNCDTVVVIHNPKWSKMVRLISEFEAGFLGKRYGPHNILSILGAVEDGSRTVYWPLPG